MKSALLQHPGQCARIARWALYVFGGLALLCVVLLALLHGPVGDALLRRYGLPLVNAGLGTQGLRLEWQDAGGPLPFAVRIQGLRVLDPRGLWLEAAELRLALDPWAALRGTVHIEHLVVQEPRLLRLPEVGEDAAAVSSAATGNSAMPLPVTVRIAGVRLERASLAPVVCGLPPEAPPFVFDAEGQGVLLHQAATAQVSVRLSQAPEAPNAAPLRLTAAWAPDGLALELEGDAAPLARYVTIASAAPLIVPPQVSLAGRAAIDAPVYTLPVGSFQFELSAHTEGAPTHAPALKARAAGVLAASSIHAREIDIELMSGPENATLARVEGNSTWRDETLDAALRLDVTDNERLLQAAATLLRADAAERIKALRDQLPQGRLRLESGLRLSVQGDASCTIDGQATDLRWANATFSALFGPAPRVRVLLERTLTAYDTTWTSFELESDAVALHGQGLLRLGAGGTLEEVEGEGTARLADIGRLVPHEGDPPVRGEAKVHLRLTGNRENNAPLRFELNAASPQLDFAAGPTSRARGVELRATGNVRSLTAVPEFDLALRLKAAEVHGAPLQAHIEATGTAEHLGVTGTAAVLGARGDTQLALRRTSTQVLADGRLTMTLTDGTMLRTLGLVPVQAKTAGLTVNLTTRGNRQDVDATLTARDLAVAEPVDARLERLDARLVGRDVFGTSGIDGTVELGAGHVAGVQWKQGAIGLKPVSGSTEQIAFTARLAGPFALEARGSYAPRQSALQLDALRVSDTPRQLAVRLDAPCTLRHASGVWVENTVFSLSPTGTIALTMRLQPEHMQMDAVLRDIPLALARLVTSEVPQGMLAATVSLRGSPRAPQGSLRLDVTDVVVPGLSAAMPTLGLHAVGTLAPEGGRGTPVFTLTATAEGFGDTPATCALRLPLRVGGHGLPEPDDGAAISARVHWQGAIASLWAFVPLPGRTVTGTGLVEATVSGTWRAPRVRANAFIADGRYEDLVAGVLVTDIALEARYDGDQDALIRLRLRDGRQGECAVAGTLYGGFSHPQFDLRGAFDSFAPLRRDDLACSLTGDVTVTGPLTGPRIAVDATVNQGSYDILGGFGGSVAVLDVIDAASPEARQGVPPARSAASLDAHVRAPGRFFVRGKGLASEWKADLHISGPLDGLSMTGSIAPVRGTFELLKREFELAPGSVTFTGSLPPNPRLDLPLTYTGPDMTATVTVQGSLQAPRLAFASEPPLPKDEIIAYVMFGKGFAQLSRLETIQLADEARVLSGLGEGRGGFRFMDAMRGTLGLDTLRFGSMSTVEKKRQAGRDPSVPSGVAPRTASGEGTASTLEAGKYIHDNVYVGVEQGAAENTTGVRVEVELLPNMSIDARSSATSNSVGLNWKKDY